MEERRPSHLRSARLEPLKDATEWGTAEDDAAASFPDLSIDQFPTSPMLAIDQWPTQPMPALVDEPFSFQHGSFVDSGELEQFDVLIQPAIEQMTETGPHPSARQTTGAHNYLILVRSLVKSSGIYALASLGAPLVSLVLSPFLTHNLSRDDYGLLTVLTTIIGLVAGITQLGLGSAFFRTYNYEYTEETDRRSVLATVTSLLVLVSLPVAIAASFAAPLLARIVLGRPSLGNLIFLTAWIVVVQNLTVPGFAWLRAENRPLFFSLLSMSNVLVVLCVNLLLLGVFHWGIVGSLIATGSGYASVVLCTLPMLLWHSRLSVRRDVAWSLLTFGVPQVLSYISYWVLQLSDRYLLSLFASYAQTGSYAVAYSLGSVLSTLVISPFSLAWPAMMFSIAKRKDAAHIFQLIFRWFSTVLLFVAFSISIAGSLLLDWLFPSSYHSAAPIIPVVAESIVFYGLYIVFMTGANIQRKMWMPAAFSSLAAVVNVVLNLVLIPRYGSTGAAASTLLAYIVLSLVAYLANQRVYPIPYEVKRFLLALLIGAGLYLGADVLALGWHAYWRLALTSACLVVYAGCLLFLVGGVGILRAQLTRLIARISSDRRVS